MPPFLRRQPCPCVRLPVALCRSLTRQSCHVSHAHVSHAHAYACQSHYSHYSCNIVTFLPFRALPPLTHYLLTLNHLFILFTMSISHRLSLLALPTCVRHYRYVINFHGLVTVVIAHSLTSPITTTLPACHAGNAAPTTTTTSLVHLAEKQPFLYSHFIWLRWLRAPRGQL